MYEQYTDEQIVGMLRPKLSKILGNGMWESALEYSEGGRDLIKIIATIYRSAYIRGQLGRSFIIGEPKRTERWVPATKTNIKPGVKVRYLNTEKHEHTPVFYPELGTIGEVMKVCSGETCRVQWPCFYTSVFVRWSDLEVLLCE